jgi:hypothetical protein
MNHELIDVLGHDPSRVLVGNLLLGCEPVLLGFAVLTTAAFV